MTGSTTRARENKSDQISVCQLYLSDDVHERWVMNISV